MADTRKSALKREHLKVSGQEFKQLVGMYGGTKKEFAEDIMGLEVTADRKNLYYWYNKKLIPVSIITQVAEKIGEEIYIELIEDIKGIGETEEEVTG